MRVFKQIPGLALLRKRPQNQIPFSLAVGQVIKSSDATTREVKVIKMELDDYLKMYFNKSFVFETVDKNSSSKKGDIVLVRKLDKPLTQKKFFSIEKVLFQIDNIIDPITGKKISHDQDEIKKHLEQLSQLYN
ncbi:28S ribosomal mitochondrial [Brachionus plicatilis]|uniref:28S ribosomal mitochondrial n=1 Tax=Brachionus plicatilis TaxID=10195 RepID=A0A3M7PBP5_BRAPC|nr:28S ribosomal mitochondrial [Brachionus plicatilis]